MATESTEDVVVNNGKRYSVVREGLASILVPEASAANGEQKKPRINDEPVQQVFYNPIQQFNRDLSVLAVRAFGQEVLERKAAAVARRKEHLSNKKRKRQEQETSGDRPQKVGKPSEPDGADGGPATTTKPGVEVATVPIAPTEVDSAANGQVNAPPSDRDATEAQEPAVTENESGSSNFKLRILDALSASGLRALRYAHELPFPVAVTANDLSTSAVESIQRNVKHNNLEESITVSQSDALAHMYTVTASEPATQKPWERKGLKYDVIDLDPYGTAAPFFDAAVQAVRSEGGLVCVTCTDAGIWASNGYSEKAFALYGGIPMKGHMSHEAGLRIILHGIATSAARHGLSVEPLLSLSIDFYCRIFVRIKRSPAGVKFLAGKTMLVYNCDHGCSAWTIQPLLRNKRMPSKDGSSAVYKHTMAQGPTADAVCEHCGTVRHLAGPMYAGLIHSSSFIQRILDNLAQEPVAVYGTAARIRGMLQTALEEIQEIPRGTELDDEKVEGPGGMEGTVAGDDASSKEDPLAVLDPHPFFTSLNILAKNLHCSSPNENAFRGALRGLGYHVTRSHCKAGSIKTNAPWSVIWEVMREWVRQKAPVKRKNIPPDSIGYILLKLGADTANSTKRTSETADVPTKVVFDEELGREQNREKLLRYQINPRENWGPMNKAKAA